MLGAGAFRFRAEERKRGEDEKAEQGERGGEDAGRLDRREAVGQDQRLIGRDQAEGGGGDQHDHRHGDHDRLPERALDRFLDAQADLQR